MGLGRKPETRFQVKKRAGVVGLGQLTNPEATELV